MATEHFPTFLEPRLPQGTGIRVYHVSTDPSPCSPLFTPPPGRSAEATTLESHFLAISQSRQVPDSSPGNLPHVLALAIEVLIFATRDLVTIFVSKADSTGLLIRSSTPQLWRTSLAQIVITAFLEFLLKPRQHRSRVVISLFARSQHQYLFPGSIENVTKHVLDDRKLIKWWCRVLDPLVRQLQTQTPQSVKAHVVVPGCDSSETKAFFPPSYRSDPISNPTWLNAYPVDLLVQDTSIPPQCLVPRLPDDPKSRFLDDLDSQSDEQGRWRGVKDLDQFWDMMSYRQECSAGRLVGFIWVVCSHVADPMKSEKDIDCGIQEQQKPHQGEADILRSTSTPQAMASSLMGHQVLPYIEALTSSPDTTNTLQIQTLDIPSVPTMAQVADDSPGLPVRETPVVTDSSRPSDPTTLQDSKPTDTPLMISSIPQSEGEIVLSAEQYQGLMDELLQLDFAGERLAFESTMRWRDKVVELAGASNFGVDVEGTVIQDQTAPTSEMTNNKTVNVLTGVRKKRKTETSEARVNGSAAEVLTVNSLPTDLIRKKAKA